MKINLTTKRVEQAACPLHLLETTIWDDTVNGLGLRVRSSGLKTWIVWVRDRARRRVKIVLGNAQSLSLARARDLAIKAIGSVRDGKDPNHESRQAAKTKGRTVCILLDQYEEDMKQRDCAPRHVSNTLSVLRRGMKAKLNADLAGLDRRAILDLMAAHTKTGARQSFRQRVVPFLNFAVNEGVITFNPMAGYRRPRKSKAEKIGQPGRSLSNDEIKAIWKAGEDFDLYGSMVRVMLLTGLRIGTVAKLTSAMVSVERQAVVIPSSIMKSGKSFAVPLTGELRKIITAQPKWAVSDLVFATRSKERKAVPVASGGKRHVKFLRDSGTTG